MKHILYALIGAIVITHAAAAEPDRAVSLTAPMICSLAAKADQLIAAGDIDSYAKMLADELVVTYARTPDPSTPPERHDRAQYLAIAREGLEDFTVRACKTTIQKTDISPDGQSAEDIPLFLLRGCF